jgi:nucleoside-diphosphate-sugar epimerase
MRVLLTGAAGRLGSETCRHLVAAGFDVVATDHVFRGDLPVRVRVIDLLDRHAVYPLLEGCEAVVHLANHPNLGSISPPQRLYAENLTMNANVFHAAVELGIKRLIFASSIQAISGDRNAWHGTGDRPSCLPHLPLDEHMPACPGNLYGLSKANTEQMLSQYAFLDPTLSCTAIRFPSLMATEWLEHYRRHRGGHAKLDEAFTCLEMRDAAALIRCVLVTNRPGYIHFVPAARANLLGWTPAEVIARFYPNVPLKQPADQMRVLVDLEALHRYYDWAPQIEFDLPRWDGQG